MEDGPDVTLKMLLLDLEHHPTPRLMTAKTHVGVRGPYRFELNGSKRRPSRWRGRRMGFPPAARWSAKAEQLDVALRKGSPLSVIAPYSPHHRERHASGRSRTRLPERA